MLFALVCAVLAAGLASLACLLGLVAIHVISEAMK